MRKLVIAAVMTVALSGHAHACNVGSRSFAACDQAATDSLYQQSFQQDQVEILRQMQRQQEEYQQQSIQQFNDRGLYGPYGLWGPRW